MATILAYTSPALGHLFPFSALLEELSLHGMARGNQMTLFRSTKSEGVQRFGELVARNGPASDPSLLIVNRYVS